MTRPKLRVPHPLALLTGCILLAAAASYVVPAGQYERAEVGGRSVVVAGTYQTVERAPVSIFQAMTALPIGMVKQGEVIFLVFLIGGAFMVVDETGALRRGTASLVRALHGRDLLIIPIVSILFGIGGVVQNMQEEIIPLIPVLLIMTARMGWRPLVAVAMSAGAAFVGSAFSFMNPFQVVIAQGVAEVEPGSGTQFRLVFLLIAMAFWIAMTMRYAQRHRSAPEASNGEPTEGLTRRDQIVLGLVGVTFVTMVYGMNRLGWSFNEMSAAFFIMGVLVGLVSNMGFAGTAEAYAKGFREMAYAALLIGFARTILEVLEQGRVVDTIVYGMFTPLESLPQVVSAVGMIVAQAALHVPVPSVSSQAVLTMPILAPVSDLLGMSRQVTVLAYQYGAGLCDIVTPTNGALMAMLAAAGVRFEEWIKFAFPLYAALVGLGAVAVAVAIAIGLQ